MSRKLDDKYMGSIKVGPKGQIVIPKEVRDMFHIVPGDSVLLLADAQKGIAIQKSSVMEKIADAIFSGRGKEIDANETQEHLEIYAQNIKETIEEGDEE